MKEQRFFFPTGRYYYDFEECSAKKGFAQIDTSEDAAWYGIWANPKSLRIVEYIEGDVVIKDADTVREFGYEIRRMAAWHAEQGNTFKIDCMCDPVIKAGFRDAKLQDLMH